MSSLRIENLLQPHDRIWVAGSSNEPVSLLHSLQQTSLPEGLTFVQFPLAGYNSFDYTSFADDTRMETFFMTPTLQKADPQRLDFLPMRMRAVYDYLARDIDVVLLQAARDAAGVLRIGPNVDSAAMQQQGLQRK